MGSDRIEQLTEGFRPVGLEEVDRRAALQRRVDNKYLVSIDELPSLLERLQDGHEILEIDGTRVFEYDSTYFDTSSLDCFHDHAKGRRPRYKARTRCYVSTGDCFFEVKVKRSDGETVKKSIEYPSDDRAEMEDPARGLLDETLGGCDMTPPDNDLEAKLVTRFRRVTLAAVDQPQRITLDFGIELDAPGAGAMEIGDRHVIVETKTPDGEGACDRLFAEAGSEPLSLSKYRLGIGLLLSREDRDYAPSVKAMFARSERAG